MKISIQQYAQSLYDSVVGKSDQEAKEICKNFAAILDRNHDLNKEEAIIAVFNDLWNTANGEVAATLSSARELDKAARQDVVEYLKARTGAQSVSLAEKIDKGLIGGFVLRYGSKVLDGSLKNSLDNLKNKISN